MLKHSEISLPLQPNYISKRQMSKITKKIITTKYKT